MSTEETCDMFMEEDCEYLGLIVYESPSGSVTSKDYCQDLCSTFEYSGCKYWSYVKNEKKCFLYDSKDRICQSIGGPLHPSITDCTSKRDFRNTFEAFKHQ